MSDVDAYEVVAGVVRRLDVGQIQALPRIWRSYVDNEPLGPGHVEWGPLATEFLGGEVFLRNSVNTLGSEKWWRRSRRAPRVELTVPESFDKAQLRTIAARARAVALEAHRSMVEADRFADAVVAELSRDLRGG